MLKSQRRAFRWPNNFRARLYSNNNNKMVYSYSPSTCLALLETMSETLLDVKYNRIKGSLDLNIHLKTKTRSKPTVAFKKEALKSALSASISDESYTLATLEERILDTVKSITVNKPITVEDVATVTDDNLSHGTFEATGTTSTIPNVDVTPTMELCENINVATSVEDVVEHINFAKIGNREIYYLANSATVTVKLYVHQTRTQMFSLTLFPKLQIKSLHLMRTLYSMSTAAW